MFFESAWNANQPFFIKLMNCKEDAGEVSTDFGVVDEAVRVIV